VNDAPLRILQITSDWKWTGPAEPMLELAAGLEERGHEVAVACPEPPEPGARSVAGEARARGREPALALGFARGRGDWWLRGAGEARRLRRLLDERRFDLVHAWHTRDHALALRAAGLRPGVRRVALVRSWRKGEPFPAAPWSRWLFGPASDGVLCVAPGVAERCRAQRGGRPTRGWFGAVDVERFAPRPPDPEVRSSLGLRAEDRVVGIVARVQPHRRFDLLLAAAALLFARDERARLLVVGRGTRRAELAEQPARRLGIADRVVFAGYRREDYGEVLRCCDVFTFLVPGSDGTCRALLEAAACGIPAVTSRRGALPEIVADGETGLLADETPEALAAAWASLLADPDRRRTLGGAARKRAETHFTRARLAAEVESLYREVLAG
jgi:glycosyltransferase involved in cell wall biosynthesis